MSLFPLFVMRATQFIAHYYAWMNDDNLAIPLKDTAVWFEIKGWIVKRIFISILFIINMLCHVRVFEVWSKEKIKQ